MANRVTQLGEPGEGGVFDNGFGEAGQEGLGGLWELVPLGVELYRKMAAAGSFSA